MATGRSVRRATSHVRVNVRTSHVALASSMRVIDAHIHIQPFEMLADTVRQFGTRRTTAKVRGRLPPSSVAAADATTSSVSG